MIDSEFRSGIGHQLLSLPIWPRTDTTLYTQIRFNVGVSPCGKPLAFKPSLTTIFSRVQGHLSIAKLVMPSPQDWLNNWQKSCTVCCPHANRSEYSNMDRITNEARSRNMARIRSRDTGPERAVRSLLHRAGFRFCLNVTHLPGRPDIVLPKWKKVIFVHGCFWHRHCNCKFAYAPKSNIVFWNRKFRENQQRDIRVCDLLSQSGWGCLVVWECELASPERLLMRLEKEIRS